MNGINKYVTETSEEIPVTSVENRGTGKPVAKAKPRPKPTLTLSIPSRERIWIDVVPRKFSEGCFEVSKFTIRLSRHDETVHRKHDPGRIVEVNVLRVLRTGQLKLGSASWQKEEDRKKGFSTA